MATQVNRRNTLYGYPNPQTGLQQEPLVMARAPLTNDSAELGTIWVDTNANTFYILTNITGSVNTWSATTGGATTLASLVVNPGNATVQAGNLDVTAGTFNVGGATTLTTLTAGATTIVGNVGVTGNTTLNGDLAVTGNIAITGDFDLTDTASISLTSTNNAAGAITLLTNGGAAETMVLQSAQGTGAGAITIDAVAGGVTIQGGLATADAINILSGATGGIDIDYGTAGMTVTGANGAFTLATGTGAINLGTDAVAHTVTIGNGTGATSVVLNAGTGAINIGTNAFAHAVTVGNNTGATSVAINGGTAGAGAINIGTTANAVPITIGNVTGATGVTINTGTGGFAVNTTGAGDVIVASADTVLIDSAGVLELNSSAGIISIGNDGVNQNINIGTAGVRTVTVGNNTGATNVSLQAGTAAAGAILIGTTANDVPITIGNSTGATAITISNGTGALNLGTNAIAHNVTIGNSTGATTVAINGGTGGAGAINIGITANEIPITIGNTTAGTSISIYSGTGGILLATTGAGDVVVNSDDTVLIDADGVLELNSSAGVISIGNDADAFDINVGTGAAPRVITIGNITTTTGVAVNTGTGGLTVTTTGTGDIVLNSDDTMLLDADGVLELNSSAGAISIGNDADAQAINIGSAGVRPILIGNASAGTTLELNAPANVGVNLMGLVQIMAGAGSPNGAVTAPAGSMWLRTDPAGATSRIYVNTDSAMTWTNVTCAA